MSASRTLSVILAADAVGYSRLAEADEKAALAAVAWFRDRATEIVGAHGGRIFFRAGDGLMAELPTASAGIRAALELAETVRLRVAREGGQSLPIRIGMHLGEASLGDDGDMMGHDVNVAARLERIAEPGEVLISRALAEAAKGKVDAHFERVGLERLKNLTEAVEVFRVMRGAPARPQPSLMVIAGAAAAAVLVALGGGFLIAKLTAGRTQAEVAAVAPAASSETPAAAEELSIAVLPFVNMSSDLEQEYFSDGLSEELLNVLAQIDELRVAGRTSSFAFKGQNQDLRLIGEQLGVAHILEGSVRKSGDRLRITAQLISAEDGYHLWSQTYDRELTDVFAVQEEIAMAVAEALSITLGVATVPVPETTTADVETYDLYLRGRAALNRGDVQRAVELFREALARDPDYAPAFGALASAYASSIGGAPQYRPDAMRALADLTAEWEARAPDAWATRYGVSLLHWYRREFSESFREMARVRELAPASAVEVAAMSAGYESYVGRATTAIALAQDVVRTDPLSGSASGQLQQALDIAGRRDEAEAEVRRYLDFVGGGGGVPDSALFRIWNDGDDARTAAVFDQVVASQNGFMPVLAAVREVFDDPEAARGVLRAGFDDPANQDPTRQMILAIYAGHYGDPELAVAALRRAYIEMGGTIFIMLWYPDLAAARRTEEFKDLVRDIGLVDYWRESGDWGDFCRPVREDDFECG